MDLDTAMGIDVNPHLYTYLKYLSAVVVAPVGMWFVWRGHPTRALVLVSITGLLWYVARYQRAIARLQAEVKDRGE